MKKVKVIVWMTAIISGMAFAQIWIMSYEFIYNFTSLLDEFNDNPKCVIGFVIVGCIISVMVGIACADDMEMIVNRASEGE